MNISPEKPWSAAMRGALLALSAIGAIICVISAMTIIKAGRVEAADVARVIGGGAWAVFTVSLRRHPEWKRYLAETLY